MPWLQRAIALAALVVSAILILPALFLATYDHQGSSPLEGAGPLAQLAVIAAAFALALWGWNSRKPAVTLLSLALLAGWVPLVVALAD